MWYKSHTGAVNCYVVQKSHWCRKLLHGTKVTLVQEITTWYKSHTGAVNCYVVQTHNGTGKVCLLCRQYGYENSVILVTVSLPRLGVFGKCLSAT